MSVESADTCYSDVKDMTPLSVKVNIEGFEFLAVKVFNLANLKQLHR